MPQGCPHDLLDASLHISCRLPVLSPQPRRPRANQKSRAGSCGPSQYICLAGGLIEMLILGALEYFSLSIASGNSSR